MCNFRLEFFAVVFGWFLQRGLFLNTTTECGIKRYYLPLILEGRITEEGEFPWLVALFHSEGVNYNYKCAGTLISNRHVITAAHCVNIDENRLYLALGNHNIENWFINSIVRRAEKIIVHHDYVNVSIADVAVVTIGVPVQFSNLITPACLWDEPINLANVIGEKGTIAGWGSDEAGNRYVTKARKIALPIVAEAVCLRSNFNFVRLTSNWTFCAGAQDGKIPCSGDSGSGFVMEREGRWKLRGLVTSALYNNQQASCDGNNYAVFTDVSNLTTWVATIIKEAYKPPSETTTIRPHKKDDMKVVCYFDSYAWYRKGAGQFLPKDIDDDLCTHITYCCAVLDDKSLIVKPGDSFLDIDKELYRKVLSRRSKGVKVLINLGSWNDAEKLSRLVNDALARSRFIIHVTQFIEAWGFDGLELDWEFPRCWQHLGDGNCQGPESDKPAFTQFVKELREAFAPRGWLLSAIVSSSKDLIDIAYEFAPLSKYVNWISVLTYNYHGSWDGRTGHFAPLYKYPNDYDKYNINFTINYLIKLGADPKKLVMSLPTFGQSFTLANPIEHGLFVESNGAGITGEFTNDANGIAFFEICARLKNENWNVVRDPKGRIGPYAYKGNQWISYDDIAEFKRKSQYVKANGLGGARIEGVDLDDFRNTCGCGRYPLLRMMNHELRGVPLEGNFENCT